MSAFLPMLRKGLVFFAVWTVVYQAGFLLRVPAGLVFWLGVVLGFALSHLLIPGIGKQRVKGNGRLLMVSGASGLITLLYSKPNADDLSFFHRAVAQQGHLGEPFLNFYTQLGDRQLPQLSVLHSLTSYEPFIGVLSAFLHLDAVTMYQNVVPLFAALLLPIVYFAIFRSLELAPRSSLVGTVGTMLFLLLDGNVSRSFGNMAFMRLWQGKCLLWTLMVPILVLLSLQWARKRERGDLLALAGASVVCAGLSNSGIYIAPLVLLGLCLAHWWTRDPERFSAGDALRLLMASGYCLLFGLAVTLHFIAPPPNIAIWQRGWPANWFENLELALGDGWALVRDIAILALVPVLAGRSRPIRFLLAYTAVIVLVAMNPITGPIWMSMVQPASFWRLAYALPLPLCAGLGFAAVAMTPPKWAAFALTVVAVGVGYSASTFAPLSTLKAPFAYRFEPADLEAAQLTAALGEAPVLAPESVCVPLGLLHPELSLVSARPGETEHVFLNAGRGEEGRIREDAQLFCSNPAMKGVVREHFDEVLRRTARVLVLPVTRGITVPPAGWKLSNETAQYRIFTHM